MVPSCTILISEGVTFSWSYVGLFSSNLQLYYWYSTDIRICFSISSNTVVITYANSFNIKTIFILPRVHVWILCDSQNEQRLQPKLDSLYVGYAVLLLWSMYRIFNNYWVEFQASNNVYCGHLPCSGCAIFGSHYTTGFKLLISLPNIALYSCLFLSDNHTIHLILTSIPY